MEEHVLPVIAEVALRYFWRHCPDPKEECQAQTEEEWEAMIDEHDRWLLEQ